MQEIFDPFNMIIIAIAVVIFMRLRSVLGRRTGNENRPYDRFNASEEASPDVPHDNNVIPLPRKSADGEPVVPEDNEKERSASQPWHDMAGEGSDLDKAFARISAVDPNFDPQSFITGSQAAYEMIVMAFANADRKTLKNLLSDDVYAGFDSSITHREKMQAHMETEFVGIESASIVDAELSGDEARVTVKFVSEIIQSTSDKDGNVLEGEPGVVREVVDIWTFVRNVKSRDPNWKLDATESSN